ncbi:hypothetical protein PSEUBRA_001279 [Kalmanozyma brasiliensis GHG001]|uniref:uncharacterized protein n=1 Tax=Kalmanozyma brasiliensis (strain GHG001) TaxID=1365824 RepID=UPI0028683409|nr:uncharacterized protein PSEUBRA_001279 [Kalmanozyma brasiliensis GHG001]KAF6766915.1 hypothetical protein PSEUBRA_001279 [Kalmanozyma brasiliensis GHG001]
MPPPQPDQVDRKRKLSLSNVNAPRTCPAGLNEKPNPISVASMPPSAGPDTGACEVLKPGYETLVRKLEQMYRESRSEVKEKKQEQRNMAGYDHFQVEQVEMELYGNQHHHSKMKALLKTIKRSNAELVLTDVSETDIEWEEDSSEEEDSEGE